MQDLVSVYAGHRARLSSALLLGSAAPHSVCCMPPQRPPHEQLDPSVYAAPGVCLCRAPREPGPVCLFQEVVRSLALDERMAVLAAAISIDYDYFSRHSQGSGLLGPMFFPMPLPPYPAGTGDASSTGADEPEGGVAEGGTAPSGSPSDASGSGWGSPGWSSCDCRWQRMQPARSYSCVEVCRCAGGVRGLLCALGSHF
jgi:hypothetical protein